MSIRVSWFYSGSEYYLPVLDIVVPEDILYTGTLVITILQDLGWKYGMLLGQGVLGVSFYLSIACKSSTLGFKQLFHLQESCDYVLEFVFTKYSTLDL